MFTQDCTSEPDNAQIAAALHEAEQVLSGKVPEPQVPEDHVDHDNEQAEQDDAEPEALRLLESASDQLAEPADGSDELSTDESMKADAPVMAKQKKTSKAKPKPKQKQKEKQKPTGAGSKDDAELAPSAGKIPAETVDEACATDHASASSSSRVNPLPPTEPHGTKRKHAEDSLARTEKKEKVHTKDKKAKDKDKKDKKDKDKNEKKNKGKRST